MSAVKALAIANAQGQRTYTITNNNLESALAQITLDIATENDIRSAVESGKQVTTHQSNITYHGWTGAGYIITDTESGAGAYKISGGADGAVLMLFISALMIVVGLYLLPAFPVLAPVLLFTFGYFFLVSLAILVAEGAPFSLNAAADFIGILLGVIGLATATGAVAIAGALIALIASIYDVLDDLGYAFTNRGSQNGVYV